ncbi:hypothetical protein ACH49_28755 [Streptomyces leeuwenhoekii]|uniref:Uncharacterized protein n=1 Tax=Streptomyces leeuwenhoekii TaxID=1437453 RepID=A0ABR5HQY2_STRLW|nr:hypothetical protein [Streptomyces leeuwenhoekii]KMS67210.1 hypothetical protein ACH49_28755 [Streptomyces leeuwenhoekii]
MTEPSRVLSEAAQQVRAFNHVSQDVGDDWRFPSHSYDAIGNLAHLARMLGQAIEQATYPAEQANSAGRLIVDGGRDAGDQMQRMRHALAAAVAHADDLAAALDRMHSAVSPMAFDTTGLPGFDEDGVS